jgi:hypothetical protein
VRGVARQKQQGAENPSLIDLDDRLRVLLVLAGAD